MKFTSHEYATNEITDMHGGQDCGRNPNVG